MSLIQIQMPLTAPTLYAIAGIRAANREVKTFSFHAEPIARESKPGQFVMVWNPGVDEIPISIADIRGELIELAIADRGDCTHSLHQKHVGDLIGLRGPYGRGFSIHGSRICMVGGGYGTAPLLFAAKRARELDKEITVLMGASTESELLYEDEFRLYGCDVRVATEDGSRGFRGRVTELLSLTLAEKDFEQVLVCGPEPMMKRVCEITEGEGIPTQIAVERIVKCGCGACGSCDLGGYRVCTEGPVFNAEELAGTEFGCWKRASSGKRIKIEGARTSLSLSSVPPPPFTPEYEPMLATRLFGIEFTNPIANAAGFGISGKQLYRYAVAGAGAVVTKSIGMREQSGYPNPTFFELTPHSESYVNAMGLPNPGIRDYRLEIEDAKRANVPLILSIFGRDVEESRAVAKLAVEYPIEMLEFNASCPHSDFVAMENNPRLLREIIKAIREVAHPIPVAVKLSPNIGDIAGLALTLERAGADAITAINTVMSRPIEPTLDIPVLGNPTGYGGKSGRVLTAGGKQVVFSLYEELKIPIIAVGGIFSARDIIDYARNGARLFQIGSALVTQGYGIFRVIKEDLKEYLRTHGYKNIGELVGEAHRN